MKKKIVFTQFTPPFEHGKTELEYLEYDDWFSQLRREIAAIDDIEVFFVSLTNQSGTVEIMRDGYDSLFFPVENPDERQHDGRLWHSSPAACKWIAEYDPDIVHIVGSGQEMAWKIQESSVRAVHFLWERCTSTEKILASREVALCDYYLHPTRESLERAAATVKREKLLQIPLGTDTANFFPDDQQKHFDIVSSGRLTPSKQFGFLQQVVSQNNLSWIHAGGYVKGHPYTFWDDLKTSRRLRRIGLAPRIKKSSDQRMVSANYNHREMADVYRSAWLMVHPSRHEGAARAVQESLACAVPVVVMDQAVPWVEPEFGVRLESVDELESVITGLLEDRARLREMGEAGRQWLIENHSFDRLRKCILGFHESFG